MEIVPGIHQVDGVNANCYILVREGLTVIDTGIPTGSGKKILTYIRETLHRDPKEIKTIIITHFHMDHTGGIGVLKAAAPGALLAVGEADSGYISGKQPLPVYPGFHGVLLRIAGLIMNPGLFPPDILLKNGDLIEGLTCIAIPGHTPGSIGLLDEAGSAFFAGDILRYDGKTLAEGPAPFTMDLALSRRSIRAMGDLAFDLLLTGHGMPLRPGASGAVQAFAETLPSDG
jgi:glyoxylase-like metal-dependent hydrolase (beta-lactamase superfamily II)